MVGGWRDYDYPERIRELEAQCTAMRKALRIIKAELGGPTGSYPQPVANAYHIAQEALASDAGKGWVSPEEHEEQLTMRDTAWLKELERVDAQLKQAQADAACPLCKGTGATKDNPCLCGGSGKTVDVLNALQDSHTNCEEQIRDLQAVRDAAKHVAYWLTKRGIANASSELKGLRAALDALEEKEE